ncbi:hypothetical protein GCM10011415_42090 [Salipiger pallidus]|uniref:Uncharacterized protein n=1 Tax=Salipiger pallidus TaxID=1775170 RepID=A0A8J2ZNV2_9RHOB|nr:hypothetical protein [Salipiger pallidus]GGG87158.1 hypothetical protein GCM10011415_42090 [Salipiger pallidus]
MFWELIAVFVAGFAGAGAVLALNRLTGRRLPRWLMPVGAGAAMLAVTISSEYGWYERTAAALPQGYEVATVNESRRLFRPWTLAVPMVDRFIAIDTTNMVPNDRTDGLWLVRAAAYGRWRPVREIQIMVDCDGMRSAIPSGDGGEPVWRSGTEGDPILGTVCEAPEAGA